MQITTRRLLCALLLFHAGGDVASARDALTLSGAVTTTPFDGLSVAKTTMPTIGAGATAPIDASEPPTLPVRCPPKPAQSAHLRVDIVFVGPPMSPRVEAAAMEEVTHIWAPYGVDVDTAGDCRRDGAVRLTVTLAHDQDHRIATRPLGSIRFVNGVPERAIVIYADAVAAIVSATRFGSVDLYSPAAFLDVIVGRVLGRALAHEIGHFLLCSRLHARDGLMRAFQPAPDLVAPDRHRYGLSAAEVTRLESLTSASRQSSPVTRQAGTPAS